MEVTLKIPQPQPVFIDPADSALVIVDMQNASLKGDGILVERGKPVIAATAALLQKFRAAGSPVIHVQSVRSPDAIEFTVFGKTPRLIEGTWNVEFVEELAPLPGEPVVEKRSHDCFNNTRMEQVLDALDLRPCRSQIVVAGVATNVCYDCAVTGFRVRSFLVYLPLDATASRTEREELLGFQHVLGGPNRAQYNTIATRSDLVMLDPARKAEDPLVKSITPNPLVFTDPLYRAITLAAA